LVKKNKIPKAAVKPLIEACEAWSFMHGKGKTDAEFFEEWLMLMNR